MPGVAGGTTRPWRCGCGPSTGPASTAAGPWAARKVQDDDGGRGVGARPGCCRADLGPAGAAGGRSPGRAPGHLRRIALLSPEGDVFDQMAGRYNQQVGPNLGVYLKGHAGDLLKVDRRGRPPEYVERPCLTIGLSIQPEVLQGLASRPGFRGRGLLARFLYSLPQSLVGHRQPGPHPSPDR